MIKDLFKNWKTVPNLLSFLRIVMVPIFAVLFYKGYPIWAVFVLFLSGLSDFLDGKIARRFNQISDLGKILDPIADKLTQMTIALMLLLTFLHSENRTIRIFSWVFAVFLLKELFMLAVGLVMLALKVRPGAAEIYGKVATFVFYAVMIFIIAFGPDVGAFREFWTMPTILLQILVVISALLTLLAFASYVPGTKKALIDDRKKEKLEKQQKEKEEKEEESK
ncbi:MAG: CDP-alcohol phosphatidyltransferase family protein [Clostridiales bacterium]|nr:CDP-alcohol phosphatidyltransferase family protein [Clostridiales bacterium]